MERLVYICEICQTILEERSAGMVCPNCGRRFDCSDLPSLRANAKVHEEDEGLELTPGGDVGELLPWQSEREAVLEEDKK